MFNPRTALFLLAEADDTKKTGAASVPPTPAEALAAAEDKTLPMTQRLGVMINALKGIPPAEQFSQVKSELETTKQTLAARDKELEAANKRITALEADMTALDQEKVALAAENKTLKATEQDIAKRASAQAKGIVQSIGIDASKLPGAAAEGKQPETPTQAAYAAFAKEKDPDKKAELFQTYKEVSAKEKNATA